MGMVLTEIQNKLCSYLLYIGDMDRDDLCDKARIPRSTAFDNLCILLKLGVVKKYSKNGSHKSKGRPKVYWSLNKERVRVKS